MTQEVKWKEYFDSFSKLSLANQKRHIGDNITSYRKLVEQTAIERSQLDALLDFIGHKNEKRKQWSVKIKTLLDEELPQVLQKILSEKMPTEEDYRK